MATQNPTGTGTTPGTSRGQNPTWWNDAHTSGWNRIRDNVKRDFETGVSGSSQGAVQPGTFGAGQSTQGAGTSRSVESGLGTGTSTKTGGAGLKDWNTIEPAVRYGHGAYTQYGKDYPDWNDKLGDKLKTEWNDLKSGRTWDEVKDFVRRGWDAARRKV